MPITEYKLEKYPNEGMSIPNYIVDGGHWYNPSDDTMLGWFTYNAEYELKNINALTRSQVRNRLLTMHSVSPFANSVNTQITLTNGEVANVANAWFDNMVTTNLVVPETPSEGDIISLQERMVADAFTEMSVRLENASVNVFISSANTNCPFGCDQVTQDNIIGINTAIAVGIPIPNPTYWTPKGYPFPVEVTHAELASIGGSILNKKNELYQVYFTHKATILMTSDYEEIANYDYSTGY